MIDSTVTQSVLNSLVNVDLDSIQSIDELRVIAKLLKAQRDDAEQWRTSRSAYSRSDTNMRNKETRGQPDTVTAIENDYEQEVDQMHAEVLSVTEDEYARILEDLELMAEERIKTLLEASSRDNAHSETPPMSAHPTISEVKSSSDRS